MYELLVYLFQQTTTNLPITEKSSPGDLLGWL